jgi:hypothetical protein
VIGGMLAATFFATLLIPMFYVVIANTAIRRTRRRASRPAPQQTADTTAGGN